MQLGNFHGHSDGRIGNLIIRVNDYRAKISAFEDEISIESESEGFCIVGQITQSESFILKKDEIKRICQKDLFDSELWLLTKENEVIDFRSKTEFRFAMESTSSDSAELYQQIIDQGESHVCEFKVYIDLTNRKVEEIKKTVCALSNSQGGHIFIGVKDDGTIPGIDTEVRKEYKAEIEESISIYIKSIKKQLSEALRDSDCYEFLPVLVNSRHVIAIKVTRSSELNYFKNDRRVSSNSGAIQNS
jgi:hypothetical protein